jgi:hypothetical protein
MHCPDRPIACVERFVEWSSCRFSGALESVKSVVGVRLVTLTIAPQIPGSFCAAAVLIAAITAIQGLRNKGRIQPGLKVLIDGASGGVGGLEKVPGPADSTILSHKILNRTVESRYVVPVQLVGCNSFQVPTTIFGARQ